MEFKQAVNHTISVDEVLEYIEPLDQFPSLQQLKYRVFCSDCKHNGCGEGINWNNPENYDFDLPCNSCTIEYTGDNTVSFSEYEG